MTETRIFSPKFIDRLKSEGYPVDDILLDAQGWYLNQLDPEKFNGLEPTEGQRRRLVAASARRTLENWTEFSETEIKAAAYDEDKDQKLPEILQAIGVLAQKWLANDLVPPPITAKEVSRQTGFSPQRITGIISNFAPTVDGFGREYRLELSDEENKPPIKKAIKQSRYESRSPGGGPVQKARFQKRRLPARLERMAQERTRIGFVPVEFQPEFPKNDAGRIVNLRESSEPVIDPDIAEIIQYFKAKGGRKWLQGTDEAEFARVLQEFSAGRETDVLIWNCFDFDWIPAKKPGDYPICVIKDTVDTSIVNYHSERVVEALEYLALVGPINPIVLTPSNEAFAQKWNYAQSRLEREQVVDAVTARLNNLIKGAITTVPVSVVRFDEYLKSRGIIDSPEDLTNQGVNTFRRKLAEDPKLAKETVEDNREYFEQFGITVKDEEIEKFVAEYFGVYGGEGIGISKIVKSGRQVMLIDLEEGRVAKTTIEGVRKALADGVGEIFPIVSPLVPTEKLDYYKWKKSVIQTRK